MPAPNTPQPLRAVTLDDRYDLGQDRIFVTGYQALVRMTLAQKERDRRAGLNTAGYVTGYRGSPLGGLDKQFARAERLLTQADIRFQTGLNEDLAATALWGTQQAELRGEGRFDGVFGLWYGKGPGVDRSCDVFRHANMAGSSRHGGVLALMGDDHTCESSTVAHQSEFDFVDVMIPILNPAGLQELMDFGLLGWAMSRFTGAWTALKCVHETVESTGSVDGSFDRVGVVIPDFEMPDGGLNIRLGDPPLAQEARLHDFKRDAMLAFIAANRINRVATSGGGRPRIGIATVGKSYLDVRQAMDDLGIDEVRANDLGIRLFKVGCPWPLGRDQLIPFAAGLETIIVVEEKRSLIEVQLREELYGSTNQPVVVGKKDEQGRWLFPVKGALDPNDVAVALGERLLRYVDDKELEGRVRRIRDSQARLIVAEDVGVRLPTFCPGCPHNTSTVVPDGARAYAGIGCHYMAQWMDRQTSGYTHMGGEGANWIGEAPFSTRPHVFQNLGDGTFNHSGALAIRAAIAAGVNITYKILFNDAVAMTGGQINDGGLTPDRIARIVAAEGAARVAVVAEQPEKYPANMAWPAGVLVHPRAELDQVQRELSGVSGCTVLIYDQTCAAEKRRRRKRGTFPAAERRVVINEAVCEGCGDCGAQSNCVAIQPVETEFGRKRQIDQSACNIDLSCLKGFCPSFVTLEGAVLKKGKGAAGAGEVDVSHLTAPQPVELQKPFSIIVTGVGGTGVVTIGAVLGMAAHLEGKGVGAVDMAGLAQKGGAVFSHLRIAAAPERIHAIRVAAGEADLVLGCDMLVAGTRNVLAAIAQGRTAVVANTHEAYPGDFARNPDFSLPMARLKREMTQRAGAERTTFVDATALAMALFSNAIAANMLMLGLAFQKGAVPLSAEAIERAIALNGEATAMNVAAFRWGRLAADDPDGVTATAAPVEASAAAITLEDIVERRAAVLAEHQDDRAAARYCAAIARVAAAERAAAPGRSDLVEAAARGLFKLMAVKDEYEVARLHADPAFHARLAATFEPGYRLTYHLAPPLMSRVDPATGRPKKRTFGPWMLRVFDVLARLKRLRGTVFDVFGRTEERRMERRLLADYEALLVELSGALTAETHAAAVALARLPEKIRGYGPVKATSAAAADAEGKTLLESFRTGAPPRAAAAE